MTYENIGKTIIKIMKKKTKTEIKKIKAGKKRHKKLMAKGHVLQTFKITQ